MTGRFRKGALSLLFLSLSVQAENGGISLGQTRVIFSAADNAQTVTVRNSGQRPYLIQSRVQNGLEDTTPAPFIVTPPLFSLPGDHRQLLRILPQGASLPADRESLFYLSVAAIPAQAEPVTTADRLSVGVRFMLKLIYRPEGLPEANACGLTFSRDARGVRIANPGAYFQTLGRLTINGRDVALEQPSATVPPRSSLTLTVDGPLHHLIWQTVTDHGGLSPLCRQSGSAVVESTP